MKYFHGVHMMLAMVELVEMPNQHGEGEIMGKSAA